MIFYTSATFDKDVRSKNVQQMHCSNFVFFDLSESDKIDN